jgi:murein DD-endopeptidase MepM/ murein hydrolase activator NlpD
MERPDEPLGRRSNRKRAEQTAQTLIAALLLGTASGCATADFDSVRRPANLGPARPVTVVLVQRGDTVQGIARRYGLSTQSVIEANRLRAPYELARGQRLVLPPSTLHVVRDGETVSSIARFYGVPRQTIVEANDMIAPDTLRPGQPLAIPFVGPKARTVTAVEVAELKPPAVNSREDPRLQGARYYTMKQPRPKPVRDGQGGPEHVEPPRETHREAQHEARGELLREKPREAPREVREERRTKVASVPAEKATGRFLWPVRGKVISPFGRRDSGEHNDGINIACEPGTPVKAADSGVVVYDGNELAAYGNLLLVRHSSGFVTAYAHNKKLLVKRGDNVQQGQVIALAGATGDVDRPQLHFEIRKGDRAVDPHRFLSRTTASR